MTQIHLNLMYYRNYCKGFNWKSLFQDRVNRALEAEEKIIMGKELSIAKRQASMQKSPSSPTESDPGFGKLIFVSIVVACS